MRRYLYLLHVEVRVINITPYDKPREFPKHRATVIIRALRQPMLLYIGPSY